MGMLTSLSADKHVEILTSRGEIEVLRSFWDACKSHRDADLDYSLFIADLFADVLRPHVVVLYDHGIPSAVLVGRLERSRLPIKIGYLKVRTPRVRVIQITGWLGKIEENAEYLIQALFRSLDSGEADVICLRHINVDSALAVCARNAPPLLCSDFVTRPQAHWICTRRCGESFTATLSRNQQSQQRRRERKIARAFASNRIKCFRSLEELNHLFRDAEIIARKTYQRRLGVGFSDSPVIRSRLEFEASKGWLHAFVLYFDEQPCAFWIGSLRNGEFLSEYLAYDPAFAKYAPGMYLMMKGMESLSSNEKIGSAETIYFGVGEAIYKERLSNKKYQQTIRYIFAPRFGPILINALRSAMHYANAVMTSVFRWAGLTSSARRLGRRLP